MNVCKRGKELSLLSSLCNLAVTPFIFFWFFWDSWWIKLMNVISSKWPWIISHLRNSPPVISKWTAIWDKKDPTISTIKSGFYSDKTFSPLSFHYPVSMLLVHLVAGVVILALNVKKKIHQIACFLASCILPKTCVIYRWCKGLLICCCFNNIMS